MVWGSLTRKPSVAVGDCLTGTTGWLTATYDVTMPPELVEQLEKKEAVLPRNLDLGTQPYRIEVRGHLNQEVETCVLGVQGTTLTFKYAATYDIRKVKVSFPFDSDFPYDEKGYCPCRNSIIADVHNSQWNSNNFCAQRKANGQCS